MPRVDLDLLRRLYEAHNEAGAAFPDMLSRDFLHEDVEFVQFAAAPGAATHQGRDAVAALFRDRFEAGEMRVEDLELTALDDRRALAAFRVSMRGSRSGVETAMRLWNLVTLEGSRIARVEEFSDEAAALDAARRRPGPAAAR
jgi:ketosteroid isomerase-like protein